MERVTRGYLSKSSANYSKQVRQLFDIGHSFLNAVFVYIWTYVESVVSDSQPTDSGTETGKKSTYVAYKFKHLNKALCIFVN